MGAAQRFPPSDRSARPPRLRWIIVAAVAVLLLAAPIAWLLGHTRDRSATFTARHGPIASAHETGEVVSHAGYLSQPVRIAATTGLTVDIRVLRPAGLTGPLPTVVLLGGHRTGRDAVDLIGDPRGIVVVALDYPYHGPERTRGVAQTLRTIPAIQRSLLDTPPAVFLALDWLLTQPWVDSTRVELMGVSLGVPFAAVAGALDHRFRRVWLIHGGADNRRWLASRLESKIPNAALRHSAATLLHLLAYGATFQTDRWAARIAPRSLVVIGATDDEQISPASVEQLHAAAGEPKELLWTEGRHVRPGHSDIVQQLLGLVRARIGDHHPSTVASD